MNTDNISYTGGVPTLGNNKPELLFDEALNLPIEKKSNWKGNIFLFFIILAIIIVGYIALTSNSNTTPPIEKKIVYSTLELSLKNLRPLDEGYYEAWLVDAEEYVSVGKFSINNKGEIYDLGDNKLERFEIYEPTAIPDSLMISIEANRGINIRPSSTIVMKGNFDETGKLELSFKALNTKKIKGEFTLATETVAETKNKPKGIWFYKNADSTIDSSLELPDAPEGWVYES